MNYKEKTKLVDGLCGIFLMALLAETTYGLVDYAYTIYLYNISSVTNVVYVLSGIALAISLVLLTVAYRKNKSQMGVYGAELLVLAITTAILPGTYISLPLPFNKLNRLFPLLFGVYYIGKTMLLFSKKNRYSAGFMAAIETIYILILSYGLYSITKPLFFAGAIVAVITFIASIVAKSKLHLIHGFEVMFAAFSMLFIKTPDILIFLCIFYGTYYIAKVVNRFLNPEMASVKAKRRKQ